MEIKIRAIFLLITVLALTVYGQLVIKARALAYSADGAIEANKWAYLKAMLTDVGVLSGLVAAALAAIAWILAIERLDVGFAYPFMALSFRPRSVRSEIPIRRTATAIPDFRYGTHRYRGDNECTGSMKVTHDHLAITRLPREKLAHLNYTACKYQ